MLLRSQGERVQVDTRVRATGVVLPRLDNIEVRTLTLREAVLAVELELGRDNRVLTPAVHVQGSLGKNECSGIRDERALIVTTLVVECDVTRRGSEPCAGSRCISIAGTSHLEETRGVDESVGSRCILGSTEGVDGVGQGIDGIGVVEGLGAERAVKDTSGIEGRAVVNVGIGLDDPDELLARVVEVQLDLVGRRTNRLVTRELELLNEVLVRVLGHLAALIRVQEDVVNVERGSNKRLLVSLRYGLCSGILSGSKRLDGPQALTNRAEIKVDLDLVVLEGDKGEGKSGVAAKPEEQGDVQCGLRESIAGGTYLCGGARASARSRYTGEVGVGDVCELSGVTNHLPVSLLLLLGQGELVPDVHPVTILAVNALTTDLNLNLGDDLLTDVVEPAGIDTLRARGHHGLVDLGESELEVCAVAQVTVAADCACYTAAEVGLSREGLLNGLHGEVGVASVRDLPESDFGRTRQENVLGAISYKLHKSACH